MQHDEYAFVVDGENSAYEVETALSRVGAEDLEIAEMQGLGGSIEDWLLVGGAAASMMSVILRAIYPFVEANKIKSIKVGDIEIDRPRGKDVTLLLQKLEPLDAERRTSDEALD